MQAKDKISILSAKKEKAPLRKGGWQPKGWLGGRKLRRDHAAAGDPSVFAAQNHLPLRRGG